MDSRNKSDNTPEDVRLDDRTNTEAGRDLSQANIDDGADGALAGGAMSDLSGILRHESRQTTVEEEAGLPPVDLDKLAAFSPGAGTMAVQMPAEDL